MLVNEIKLIVLNQLSRRLVINWLCHVLIETYIWTTSSEFGTYSLCEQRKFRRACASAQSRQNLRCSLIQAVSQEEHSDRKPDPWPLWMAGHALLKFVMMECSKTQIRLAGLIWSNRHSHAGVVTWLIDLENWRYTKQKQKALFNNTFLPTCLPHFLPFFQYISADPQAAEFAENSAF